jgi:hypothetical protein
MSARSLSPSSWSSFHVAISIHECHLAPSLGLDQPISIPHLEHRVSPNRFHQLTKTKLGHSVWRHADVATWVGVAVGATMVQCCICKAARMRWHVWCGQGKDSNETLGSWVCNLQVPGPK